MYVCDCLLLSPNLCHTTSSIHTALVGGCVYMTRWWGGGGSWDGRPRYVNTSRAGHMQ